MEKKKPEIRFNGFEGEWETTTLGACSKKIITKNNGNEYNIVLTNSAERGIVDQRSYFDREIVNTENIQGYYIVSQDDFVYNPRISMQAPVGPINRSKIEYTGVMSPLYYVFRITDKRFNLTYLEWFFKSSSWHDFMYKNGNSGARSDRFSINDDVFLKLPIYHSKDISEQEKIGVFLTTLDNLIVKLEAKLDKLRKLKQALLEKMFANVNRGNETPEIRFKGYTDKWEVKELREVLITHPYKKHIGIIANPARYPIIQQGNNPIMGLGSGLPYLDFKDKIIWGDHTTSVYRPTEPFLVATDGIRILSIRNMNQMFLWNLILYIKPIPKSYTRHFSMLVEKAISIPSIEEQDKIGLSLTTLENILSKTSTKLTKLRNIKQSLLQKMFA